MVKIRLLRAGAKKRPFYRVIAIDQRRKRNGRALEFLGTYNPVADPVEIELKKDRIEAWRTQGAQLTDAVKALIRRAPETVPEETPATGEGE
jgi:small subunit ribosomal protein S16